MHKTIKEQENKINQLENMNKTIQNTDFFRNVSLAERLKIIDKIWEEYGNNVSCDALDVTRDAFHNHQK